MTSPASVAAAGTPPSLSHRQILVVFSGLLLAMLLAELFSEWPAEKHDELAALLRRLAREIVPDTPSTREPPRATD